MLDYTIRDLFAPPISHEFYGWIHRGVHLAWYQTRVTFSLSPGHSSRSSVLPGHRRRLLLTVSDPTTHLSSSTGPAGASNSVAGLSLVVASLLYPTSSIVFHPFHRLRCSTVPLDLTCTASPSYAACSLRARRCHVPTGRRLSRTCRLSRAPSRPNSP
jgi:hypothetical protein